MTYKAIAGKDYTKVSASYYDCNLCCTDEFETKRDLMEHLKEVHPNGENFMETKA